MNLLREIASWRPEVESLDPDTADQIWEQILNGGEASTASPHSPAPPRENQISLTSRDTVKPHSRSLVVTVASAAAVLLVVVGGLVFVGNRVSAPVTNEAPTTSTDRDRGGVSGTQPSWETFPAMPIAPRYLEAAVGTDDGIFVWGGLADESSTTLSDGAYYDGERWRVLPEAPLDPAPGSPTALWTGTEVVVVSGSTGLTAAAFDPGSFTWRPIAPPQGQLDGFVFPPLFHLGDGRLAFMWQTTVQTYDPATNTWSEPSGAQGLVAAAQTDGGVPIVGYAHTDTFVGILVAGGGGCGAFSLWSVDTSSMTWTDHEFTEGLEDVTPTGLAPLPSGRFMATTRSCNEPTADGTQRAYSVDPVSGSMTRLADPPNLNLEHRYAPLEIGDQLLYLGSFHPALVSYQPASDRWFTGAVLDLDGAVAISDTPIVEHDDRVVIVSTGLVDADTSTCCTPTADAWITDMPTATTSGTTAPTSGAGYTPLALSEPPEGYRLVSARWGTGSGGGGSAVYANLDTSNRLEIVSTTSDRRPPTVTAPGQATWTVGRHNVTASSETGCSQERCGIVLQWGHPDTRNAHLERTRGRRARTERNDRGAARPGPAVGTIHLTAGRA